MFTQIITINPTRGWDFAQEGILTRNFGKRHEYFDVAITNDHKLNWHIDLRLSVPYLS